VLHLTRYIIIVLPLPQDSINFIMILCSASIRLHNYTNIFNIYTLYNNILLREFFLSNRFFHLIVRFTRFRAIF